MNHGQFYRSAELVAAVHRGSGGIFGGFRAAHAFGRLYSGTFTATPAARALSRVDASTPDAATGKPDLTKLRAFLAGNPNAAKVAQLVQSQLALVSFAQASYRPLHTCYFENAAGEGRWARYHWEPEAGVAGQPPEELERQPHDYLFDEIEGRLRADSVLFRLELQLAGEGDPVHDPSAMWADDRERVVVGRLELFKPTTEAQIGDPVMMHDPTEVTDGIEVSPDDQIIAARRGAYLMSVAERTGGWRQRSAARGHPTG